MPETTIFIVEDEAIVAADLTGKLTSLGYTVCGSTAFGEDALALVQERCPDLVLMDIRLAGAMDGVEAAERIRRECDVPVIYLTAHSDRTTLDRAKRTEPFGFILKPFDERELELHIEMALYKHQAERKLRDSEQRWATTLASIGDAVIACDTAGNVTFLNPVAAALTGWAPAAAQGQPVAQVFRIISEVTHEPAEDLVARVLRENRVVELANHTALVTCDGRAVPVEDSAAPILDAAGRVVGVVIVFHDVTEKRRAEEALQESEARIRKLGDNLPDGAIYRYLHAPDGTVHFEFISAGIERIIGVPPAEILADAAALHGTILPEDMTRLMVAEAASRDQLTRFEMEVRQRHRQTGEVRWSLLRSMPTRLADGSTVWDGLQLDITERKRIEEALRESEERFQLSMEATNDGLWDWSLTTDEAYFSPAYYRILGYEVNEFPATGASWKALIHPDDYERTQQIHQECIEGHRESFEVEYRMQAKDGGWRWILGRGKCVARDDRGRAMRMVGTYVDITARQQAAEERERLLAESEATFAAIADGIIVYDTHGQIVRMNAEAWRLSGYTVEDAERPSHERMALLRMSRADGTPFAVEETPMHRALQRQEIVVGETMVLHLREHTHWVSASAAPIMREGGQILGVIVTLTDITRLHEMQEQMKTFIHMVSHDLRAPLTITNGYVDLLQEHLAVHPDPMVQMSTEAIQRAVKRMDAMIDDLVTVARLEGGQLILQCTPLDLTAWLPDFLARSSALLDPRRLRLEMPATLPTLLADADRLERILTNLISNALKYSDPDTPVQVRVYAQDGAIHLAIADQGPGIAPEHVAHLFEKFYRADSSRKAEGIGLGLYITHLLVAAHGGQTRVESVPGKGSTFSVTLPVAATAAAP